MKKTARESGIVIVRRVLISTPHKLRVLGVSAVGCFYTFTAESQGNAEIVQKRLQIRGHYLILA